MKDTIVIGSDHRGFDLKQIIIKFLVENFNVIDKGCFDKEPCDYPDYAQKVCESIGKDGNFGILICGSGVGMSITANKFKGIYAALVRSVEGAKLCRQHNAANVLCLPGILDPGEVEAIVRLFLVSSPSSQSEDRHHKRLNKIKAIEEKTMSSG